MSSDDMFYRAHDSDDYLPRNETPLVIREIGDFELRFYFNPSRFNIEENDIKPLMTRASLRTGISKSELNQIRFGEIVVRLNPAVADEEDVKFIKKLFLDYFGSLSPVTL